MSATRPVALVTGAYSGLGKSAALGLVNAGFDVVGTSRSTDGLDRREGVTFFDLDVTSDESVALLDE
jgi:NAD(P)-dependent dehydrogenase (short-subunit alcohol dehydrogenase family)